MKVRALLGRALASRDELEAAEERAGARAAGCTLIADVPDRTRARVSGVLRSVTLRPKMRCRALVAELYDGSGALDLIFLGRRDIAGIEAGRHLLAEGLVARIEGRRVMFDPRYELQVAA